MAMRLNLFAALSLLLGALPATADDIRVADDQLFGRLDANGDGWLEPSELPDGQSQLFARLLRLGDKDGDGRLTHAEWQQAIKPRRPAKPIEQKRASELPGADAARLLLLKLDADGDGMLTKAEAPEEYEFAFRRIVDQYDRNDDERVDRVELARGGPGLPRIAQQAVRRLDLDVDRELQKLDRQQGDAAQRFSERPDPRKLLGDPRQAAALFQQLDRNNDGKIERDELPEQAQGQLGRLFRFGDRNRDNALSQREFLTATERASRLMRAMSPGDE